MGGIFVFGTPLLRFLSFSFFFFLFLFFSSLAFFSVLFFYSLFFSATRGTFSRWKKEERNKKELINAV